jgi:hypothetical protein
MALVSTTCYTSAVGLSRNTCPCAEKPPTGYNEADSDLFITDLKPLDELGGFDKCGDGSIWESLETARKRAILQFMTDTDALMAREHRKRREPWVGGLFRVEKTGTVSNAYTYNGIRLRANPLRGGFMKITKIGVWLEASGTFTAQIFDRNNQQVGSDITLTSVANRNNINTLATAIELPLSDDFMDFPEYFLIYEKSTLPGAAAINRASCGCGGSMSVMFNTDRNYCCTGKYRGVDGWANYLMIGGWSGNTLTDFDDAPVLADNYGYGMTLSVEFGCRAGEILCKDSLNFSGNPLAMSIAVAVQYKAAEYIALDILSSQNLNRSQLVNREMMQSNMQGWRRTYNEAVAYVAAHADLELNDCLSCKPFVQQSLTAVIA